MVKTVKIILVLVQLCTFSYLLNLRIFDLLSAIIDSMVLTFSVLSLYFLLKNQIFKSIIFNVFWCISYSWLIYFTFAYWKSILEMEVNATVRFFGFLPFFPFGLSLFLTFLFRNKIKEDFFYAKLNAINQIKNMGKVYPEISLKELSIKVKMNKKKTRKLVETAIINGELEEVGAIIIGDKVVFNKTPRPSVSPSESSSPIQFSPPSPTPEPAPAQPSFQGKRIEIRRGGDWKVERGQSVFYFKVKVTNLSEFLIGNIRISLTSIPSGLNTESDKYIIDSLKPGSYESPTFKLKARQSCVGDTVEGIVTYTDPFGNMQTVPIEPFEICYVCNLLMPKQISKQEFDQKTQFMEDQKLIIDSDLDISLLEAKIEQIVRQCNFALLQELQASQTDNFKMFEAFAEGFYDKQDVALSVAVQKVNEGSQLVVKAMSDRADKVTDILRDFSVKLDDIKSDTELIKEYSAQIDVILDQQEDMEQYLKDHLASDWEKIKNSYQDYKDGKISRKDLIYQGIKLIGKKFVKNLIGKVSPL